MTALQHNLLFFHPGPTDTSPTENSRNGFGRNLAKKTEEICLLVLGNDLSVNVAAASNIPLNFEQTCENISAFGWFVYSSNQKEVHQNGQEVLNLEARQGGGL